MDPRNYVGTVSTATGAVSAPDGAFNGIGLSPREFTKTSTDTANEGADVILRNGLTAGQPGVADGVFGASDTDPRPGSSITMLDDGDDTVFGPILAIPTSPGSAGQRPRWAISVQGASAGTCSQGGVVPIVRALTSPVLPGVIGGNYVGYASDLYSTTLNGAGGVARPATWVLRTTEAATFNSMQLSLGAGNTCAGSPNARIVQSDAAPPQPLSRAADGAGRWARAIRRSARSPYAASHSSNVGPARVASGPGSAAPSS